MSKRRHRRAVGPALLMVVLAIAAMLAACVPPRSGGVAVTDGFQRGSSSGWGTADTGGWWSVVGSPWEWAVLPGAGVVNAAANDQELGYLSQSTVQDVDITETMHLPRCTGTGKSCESSVIGRYSPAFNPTYYSVGLVQGAGSPDIFLRATRSDGTPLSPDLDTHLPASDGAALQLRVQLSGVNPTAVRAYVWSSGGSEPGSWLLDTTDNDASEQRPGMVGVRFYNQDSGATHTFQVNSYVASGTATPVTTTPNPTGTAHLLYVVDDGHVYVYDIDNNHALVKDFAIPEAGKRGLVMAPSRGLLYISECGLTNCSGQHGSLLAYDLVHDVVAWIANYKFGVDQPAITPDGSKIYMSHGDDAVDFTHTVLDANNGKPIASITTGTNGHNTIVSLDGKQVFMGGYSGSTSSYLHVVDTATNQVTLNAGPTVKGIRPFTINGKHTLAFTTSSDTCGFQVLDLTKGQVLATVGFGGYCMWQTNAPSHGISLSPDERRVYVVDAPLHLLEVYDVGGLRAGAPAFVASVPLGKMDGNESPCQSFCVQEGWALNDLSGRYVYVGDAGNIVDTSTLKVVATLAPLQNTRQVIEIDWANGATSGTSTRFGVGRLTS